MSLPLPSWEALATLADDQWPLLPAVLRVAADEFPHLDPADCGRKLQALADGVAVEVASIGSLPLKMAAINAHLFHREGFAGDTEDYYAADNNHLNRVLERRRGNPISLALVQMEVAARLGVPVRGIAFPGHFLTRLEQGEDNVLVMDPFHGGRPLGLEQVEQLAAQHLGGQVPAPELLQRLLQPASARGIVLRLLRNLQRSWATTGQWERVARCADRQLRLAPALVDACRDRGLAYLQMGHLSAARRDLERYLELAPDAGDTALVRDLLTRIAHTRVHLH